MVMVWQHSCCAGQRHKMRPQCLKCSSCVQDVPFMCSVIRCSLVLPMRQVGLLCFRRRKVGAAIIGTFTTCT